jgi:hypothetical protein
LGVRRIVHIIFATVGTGTTLICIEEHEYFLILNNVCGAVNVLGGLHCSAVKLACSPEQGRIEEGRALVISVMLEVIWDPHCIAGGKYTDEQQSTLKSPTKKGTAQRVQQRNGERRICCVQQRVQQQQQHHLRARSETYSKEIANRTCR